LRIHIPLALAFIVLLAGCASPSTKRVDVTSQQTDAEARKQMDLLVEDLVAERTRLHRVHWNLASHSADLCPRRIHASGVDVMSLPEGELAPSYRRLFGIQEQPTVLSVVPGSPADVAGIKAGDVLVSMWGLPMNEDNSDVVQERARNIKTRVAIPVQVRRAGQTLDLTVEPVVSCDYPVVLSPQQVLNASADGDKIFITRGMMAFSRTDEELALVVGHEMAHNTMRHIDAKKRNATAGLVGDLALAILTRGAYSGTSVSAAASQAYSQEFEAEADYVGLYMLARSGYSVQDAPKFWRRMASANPGSIKGTHTSSHPPSSYRMVALEEAAKEIEGKRATSASLLPVRKDGKPFVAGEGLFFGTQTIPNDTANCMLGTDGQCMRR
jgi:membrane-associated protease RseP (regulator of RpoE activity)